MNDPRIDIWGRCILKDDSLYLYWSGSGIEFDVEASELYVDVYSDYSELESWLLVIINGAITQRILVPKGSSRICVFRALNRNTRKRVMIVKDNQPYYLDNDAYLRFESIETDGEIYKADKHRYNLEFISDSLASGEAIGAGKDEQDYSPQNATADNFVMMTSRLLDAKYSCLSLGGWGVKFSWDGNMNYAMPLLYDEVCGVMNGQANRKNGTCEKYDFKDDKNYIIVHLGTNDTNALLREQYPFYDEGDKLKNMKDMSLVIDEEKLDDLSSYVYDFISTLKKRNPSSKIIWLYGVMLMQAEKAFIKAVDDYLKNNNDDSVYYLRTVYGMNDLWAQRHPSRKIHEQMARQIFDKIMEIEKNNE